jgi:hypothetical protein
MPHQPQKEAPMSTDGTRHSDEDYFGFFMSALMGLEDNATMAGYSEEGTAI